MEIRNATLLGVLLHLQFYGGYGALNEALILFSVVWNDIEIVC
jgi:hypothetical protein